MKKISAIACLTMLIVMLTSAFCFGAESFKITSTYPQDGATDTTKDNMCVKVYFNKDVGNKSSKAANKDEFSITDKSGNSYPVRIYYSSKDTKYALILLDTVKVAKKGSKSIKDNKEYICTISKNFQANDGEKLGVEKTVEFKTMNQGRNTMIYMVMMFLMFGGMFGFSAIQMRKSQEKEKEKEGKEEAFNPYKEAKRTGKSVEELIAKHEKEVERKNAHKKAKEKLDRELDEMYADDDDCYRVTRPRPISAAGSTFVTGRKAEAEARKAAEAAKKAELKATNYGKNPKGSKKK